MWTRITLNKGTFHELHGIKKPLLKTFVAFLNENIAHKLTKTKLLSHFQSWFYEDGLFILKFSKLIFKVFDNLINRKNVCCIYPKQAHFFLSPTGNYMFKVNNRNARTRCEICSRLTIKTPEQHQWLFS